MSEDAESSNIVTGVFGDKDYVPWVPEKSPQEEVISALETILAEIKQGEYPDIHGAVFVLCHTREGETAYSMPNIVVSSCNTMNGDIYKAVGLLSLGRAFLENLLLQSP